MLYAIASSNSSCVRGGNAATAAISGCGAGSMREAVERISGPVCQVNNSSTLLFRASPSSRSRKRRRLMLVWRWTSIGFPPRERRNRPAAPMDRASPPPSSDSPSASAFAINRGISANTPTRLMASPSSPIAAVSSSPLRWRRIRLNNRCSSMRASMSGSGEGIGLLGGTGHKAHHRPHQERQERFVENSGLERAPQGARKHEVMVIVPILRDRHAHQQIEDLDRRHVLPEPLEEMVRVVPLAAAERLQEGLLGLLDPAGVQRRKLQ